MPHEDVDEALKRIGRAAAPLLLPDQHWVHRRVQSMGYLDLHLVETGVSIDFTTPESIRENLRFERRTLVPLSVLPKWPPVLKFDFRDEEGRPLPLLTTHENGIVDHALLTELSRRFEPSPSETFRSAISRLTLGHETDLSAAFDQFLAALQPVGDDLVAERVIELAALMAQHTILWAPVRAEPGHRTIVKLRYVVANRTPVPWYRSAARSLSWAQPIDYLTLPHIGADASFHVEVEAPTVLLIKDLRPVMYRLLPETTVAGAPSPLELRPTQHVALQDRIAHAYIAGRRPLLAILAITLAAPRRGFVAAAFTAVVAIATLVTMFAVWRAEALAEREASVAILAIVPAIVGYLVVRPAEHPVAKSYLLGVRLLVVGAAAVPIGYAVALVALANKPALAVVAVIAVIMAWALAAMAGLSLMKAEPYAPDADGDDEER